MTDAAQIDIDDSEPAEKLNTSQLEKLLAARYPREQYALFFDVPDNIGMHSKRRADAICIGLWQSNGRLIDGFELKVSRSDWLRELKHVQKADPFIERCDRWWLVTADATIAKPEEIPECWGWMSATKTGLRVQRPAPRLPRVDDRIDRLFALALFRKCQENVTNSPEVRAMLDRQREVRDAEIAQRVENELRRRAHRSEELQKRVEKFERSSGMKLDDWHLGDVGRIARAIADLRGYEGFDKVSRRLQQQEDALADLLEKVRETRQAIEAKEPT